MGQRDRQRPPLTGTIPAAWQQLFDTEYKVAQGRFEGWRDSLGSLGREYDWPQGERSAFEYDFYLQYAHVDLARHRGEVQNAYAATAFSAMKVRARAIDRMRSGKVIFSELKEPKSKDVKGNLLGPKAHASNWELVCFVGERLIPFKQLVAGNLLPGRHGPQVWARLREEWNRLHPHHLEQKRSDETVAREYRRAVAVTVEEKRHPTPLAREFLHQVKSEYDEAREEYQRFQEAIARSLAPKPASGTNPWDSRAGQAFLAALGAPSLSTHELRQHLSRDQFTAISEASRERRDAMARKHWVEFRVRQIWVTSLTNPQAHSLLQSYPLRPWFLREARGESYPLFDWALPFEG